MNKSMNIHYSNEALDDLKEIYTHLAYELLVPETARRQIDRIRKAVLALEYMPLRHPLVGFEPWNSMQIRQLIVDNYLVYYLVEDEKNLIEIARIFYGRRDVEIHSTQFNETEAVYNLISRLENSNEHADKEGWILAEELENELGV